MLKQTIENSLQAIRTTDYAKKQKSSIDAYTKALANLNTATKEIKATFTTAQLMEQSEILEYPVFTEEQKGEVLESISQCMSAVKNSDLTIEIVKLLQARGQSLKKHEDQLWKAEAVRYSQSALGYLSLFGGILDDKKKKKSLETDITLAINGSPTKANIDTLTKSVKETMKIASDLSLNEEIETFFKKVANNSATVADLTPEVTKWLSKHQMLQKLRVAFQ